MFPCARHRRLRWRLHVPGHRSGSRRKRLPLVLLLTMSIPGRESTAAMLVSAGFAVVLVLVNVPGFCSVLAHGWHEDRLGAEERTRLPSQPPAIHQDERPLNQAPQEDE